MQMCGLSAADHKKYRNHVLNDSHEHRVIAEILNLQMQPVGGAKVTVLDGQVDMDCTVDLSTTPSRKLTATLWDPSHTLDFDTASPNDSVLYADRLIRVFFQTYVPALGKDVNCPVFTGPVRGFTRDGNHVQVTAVGKEELALGDAWTAINFPRGFNKVAAIRSVLADRAGETSFNFPQSAATLPHALSLASTSKPWQWGFQVARGMTMRLGYDSMGRCTLRPLPNKPILTIADHDTGVMGTPGYVPSATLQPLQVGLDMTGTWYNGIRVLGATPKGSKKQLEAVRFLHPSNPISPQSLARNGVPYRKVNTVTDSALKTQAEVDAHANQLIADAAKQTALITVPAKPMPWFDDDDLIQAHTEKASFRLRLSTWSLPLKSGNPMTLGYDDQVSAIRPHIRPRRH